jgi:hypothetical protein
VTFNCPSYLDQIANQVSNGTSRLRLHATGASGGYLVDIAFYPTVQTWCWAYLGTSKAHGGLDAYEFQDHN